MDNAFAESVIDDIIDCWSVHIQLLDRYLFCGDEK
jgi:hypothetical protein